MVVAASHSGAGKTTVVSILLRALRERGLTVQAFKIGPDFIDTAYHTEATGRPAVNLDLWMMGADGIKQSFDTFSADADISVIEAMGALFDGADGTDVGSAAHLAKLLRVPVVVVLDVWGMTRTTGAVLDGIRGFDPELDIVGCVLNRVGGQKHAKMILGSLRPESRKLVAGTIVHRPELVVPERHLGLVTVEESPVSPAERDEAYRRAAADLDLDRLLSEIGRPSKPPIAATPPAATPPAVTPPVATPPAVTPIAVTPIAVTPIAATPVAGRSVRARLAVARDAAFCFYYEENLRLLQSAGFELVPFSPIRDRALPQRVDAIYFGGGYPESFAGELAANTSLAAELRSRAAAGTPIYAECGGLMYLGSGLTGYQGNRCAMADVLPIEVVMDPRHLAIRYVEVHTRLPSLLGPAGTRLRGQEFHQSRITSAAVAPDFFTATSSDGASFQAGYASRNVVASYIHVHFGSNPQAAQHFVASALAARADRADAISN